MCHIAIFINFFLINIWKLKLQIWSHRPFKRTSDSLRDKEANHLFSLTKRWLLNKCNRSLSMQHHRSGCSRTRVDSDSDSDRRPSVQSISDRCIGGGSPQLYYHDCSGTTSQVTPQGRRRSGSNWWPTVSSSMPWLPTWTRHAYWLAGKPRAHTHTKWAPRLAAVRWATALARRDQCSAMSRHRFRAAGADIDGPSDQRPWP